MEGGIMATRGRIGIKQKDGTIITAYQHWDSYLSGLGYNLCEHWTNPKKVLEAIQLGNASKWGMIIGSKIDFDDRENAQLGIQNSGKITPTQFKLLEEDAILDHIEELKRHLETRKKERQVA
jgi:hypothetical protein